MVEATQYVYHIVSQPYALLSLAFVLDLLIGDPRWLPHPVRIMGRAIITVESLLREILIGISHHHSRHFFEKGAGILLVVIIAGSTFTLFYIVNSILLLTFHFSLLTSYLSLLVMVYLISTTLATKGLIDSVRGVIEVLKNGDIEAARRNLGYIVSRDTNNLEEECILRATIESLSENTSDGIIAPLFYFVIGGLPLAMTYKAINTMDSMVGYKNDKYRHFGWAAARLDDIANYIPARITGILIAVSSFIVFRSLFIAYRSLKIMFRDGRKHLSPNSGIPEAAIAGALGIRLGGPSTYGGLVVNKPSIGEDRQSTEHRLQNTDNLYLEASEKAMIITEITSLIGLIVSIGILHMRTAV